MAITLSTTQQRLVVLAATLIAVVALIMPAHKADAALMDRVNEAIREAGVKTTVSRSNAFQTGVYIGHYTTYNQLVGAILYHKANETLPSWTQTEPTVATKCIIGNVNSMSNTSLSVYGEVDGKVSTKTLHITTKQYNVAITDKGAMIGSDVTVCSADNFFSQYGHLTVI